MAENSRKYLRDICDVHSGIIVTAECYFRRQRRLGYLFFLAGTGFFAGWDFFTGSAFLCSLTGAFAAGFFPWLLFFAACLAAGAGFAAGRRTTLDGTAFDGSDLAGAALTATAFMGRAFLASGR